MTGHRTALIAVVPEAEPAVSRLRMQLDPVAELGVPAHITVLFPFMPATEIDDGVLERLASLFRAVPAFDHNLVDTGWFGNGVLWLASDADERFRSLTSLVCAAFAAYPPYEGQFDDVVPHLTIADHAPIDDMKAAEQAVQRNLPISATAQAVTLMVEQASGRWEAEASFPLDG